MRLVLRTRLACLVAATALGGCAWHDRSKDVALTCVQDVGSRLCVNPATSEYHTVGADDPSVFVRTVYAH